jgi:pimeloyl-ACP methyl ester carboxylesterase
MPIFKPASIFACLFILSILMTACQPMQALFEGAPNGKIELTDCMIQGLEAECGQLKVYEDREAQSGRTININVVVVRARGSQAQPDPLFYFAGGPGGPATQSAGITAGMFSAVNLSRDIVFIDQRGTGASNLMLCPEQEPDESLSAYAARCMEELPGDPRFYTTTIAMDDIDDVRQALGYDQINLYGISYGATAAQVYLNRHPEHVRSMILDHGTLLQISIANTWALNTQLALEKVFARCLADPACGSAYPNLPAEFDSLLASLDQPVQTDLFDPYTSERITFTPLTFGATIHYLLLHAERAAKLPSLIHQASQGDWEPLAGEYIHATQQASADLQRMVMTQEIICHEDWWGASEDEILRLGQDSYYLENMLNLESNQQTMCPYLPDPGESAHHGPALASEIPVLLMVGEADPQDPIENAAGYQELWPNSLAVIQPGISHEYTPHECWTTIMTDFIANGSVEDLPLECVNEFEPPQFEISE